MSNPNSYLEYLMAEVEKQKAKTMASETETHRPTPDPYAQLLAALAYGLSQAQGNTDRQPGQTQVQRTGNQMQGLFGGGYVRPENLDYMDMQKYEDRPLPGRTYSVMTGIPRPDLIK